MTFSQKYCLVQPFEPLEIGHEFAASDWPLHCTVVGVFALDWTEAVLEGFSQQVSIFHAFSAITAGIEYFGEDGSVKVRLVENAPELQRLHDTLADFIISHSGTFNDPQFQHAGFRPHSTMRGDEPTEGASIRFTNLVLIDMFPDGDPYRRRIIRTFPLDEPAQN